MKVKFLCSFLFSAGKKSILGFMAILLLTVACNRISEPLTLPDFPLLEAELFLENQVLPEDAIWVDCRSEKSYSDGHIPGAINLNRFDIADTLGNVLPSEVLQHILGKKGIQSTDRLLLYDDNGGVEAARIWWVLNLYGFSNSSILNGGIQAWKANKLPVNQKQVTRPEILFEFPNSLDSNWIAFREEIDQNKTIRLFDVRSDEEFSGGEIKQGASYAGKIEGAQHLDYMKFLSEDNNGVYKIKPISEISSILSTYQLNPDQDIVAYCHSGVRSSLFTFILRALAGYPKVRNYDGSWVEWSLTHPKYEEGNSKN